jgi:hypothetical protein
MLTRAVAALVALGAVGQPASAGRDACGFLTAGEIQAVQGAAITERKGSETRRRALRFAQCVFAASDVVRSVSLTVITGTTDGGGQVRAYWDDTFGARTKEVRPIPDAGEAAVWTGDARAGALYVLTDRAILRISVGGVTDEEERIRRSRALAHAALRRLPSSP